MLISSLLFSLMQTGLCKNDVGWMCAHSVHTHTGLRFKEAAAWLPSLFAHGCSGDDNFLTERDSKTNKQLPPTLMLFFILSKQGSWSCELLRLFRNEKQQIGRFQGRVRKCNQWSEHWCLVTIKSPFSASVLLFSKYHLKSVFPWGHSPSSLSSTFWGYSE